MAEIKMRVIRSKSPLPRFASYAEQLQAGIPRTEDVYLCGECGIIITRHLPADALQHSVIRCPNCHALNEAPASLRA